MEKRLINKSKFLSLVLRHRPEKIGIELDENGWVSIDVLLRALASSETPINFDELMQIVRENNKKRFTISEDGGRIRAVQGHSIDIDLKLLPLEPPLILHHGTVAEFVPSIRNEGLRRRSRQFVHLSADEDTARAVGARRGRPIILRIDAGSMNAVGHAFFLSENGVWLTEHVPALFIIFPEEVRKEYA